MNNSKPGLPDNSEFDVIFKSMATEEDYSDIEWRENTSPSEVRHYTLDDMKDPNAAFNPLASFGGNTESIEGNEINVHNEVNDVELQRRLDEDASYPLQDLAEELGFVDMLASDDEK